jgi:hypothetical protein
MKNKFSKSITLTVALSLAVFSSIPRGALVNFNFSPIREARAQLLGGGGGGIMQMLPQLLMLMMLMQMMQQKKGDTASGKVKEARDNGLQNLLEAGGSPKSPAVLSPKTPGVISPK